MRLQDKVILVTASTRGIGLAIVKKCAEEGAKVYMAARDLNRNRKLRKLPVTLPATGQPILPVRFSQFPAASAWRPLCMLIWLAKHLDGDLIRKGSTNCHVPICAAFSASDFTVYSQQTN